MIKPTFQFEKYRTICIIQSQGNTKGTDLHRSKYPNLFDHCLLCPSSPSRLGLLIRSELCDTAEGRSILFHRLLFAPPLTSSRRSCSSPNWKSREVESFCLMDSQFTSQYGQKHFAKLPFRNNYHLGARGLEPPTRTPLPFKIWLKVI